mgnify:FL=1
MMTEDDKELLIETSERAKSNTHQIEELKADMKEMKQDQKAIYELSTAVKLVAQNVGNIQHDVTEIKQGQKDLSNKVDNQINEIKTDVDCRVSGVNNKIADMEQKPYKAFIKTKHEIIVKIVSGIGIALAAGVLTYICTLIGQGAIKI